ncbi:MAG: hypothetical protein JSU91_04600 [Thermoplasmatales archaeon]|nr:MAG: hypothetical protein JSU91_04600 [Thermoplasmatales archaeon]
MKIKNNNNIYIYGIIFLLIGASLLPSIYGYDKKTSINSTIDSPLNDDYINAYWKADECSGNILEDSSGHNYDGIINGATWDPSGYSGCALVFDGIDDYVNFTSHSVELGYNKTDDFIISFYFKSSDDGVIYSTTAPWGFNPDFQIELLSNGTLFFKLLGSSNLGIRLYSTGSYNDGSWHFVEIYHNGISSTPTATLYVDNVFDNNNTGYYYNMYNDEYTKATMGVNAHTLTNYFDGYIDEFKIVKYELGNEQDPPIIDGPTGGLPDVEYDYTFTTIDPETDNISILIDWDDGTEEYWRGPYISGEEVTVSHTWDEEGYYNVTAKSKDFWDDSTWSDPYMVIIGDQPFPLICCDSDGLNFGSVSAGSTVNGEISVINCGDPGSFLNWYVDTSDLPTWGDWTFTPSSGEGVGEGDSVNIDVTCVVTDTEGEYSGQIIVINDDNPSDTCTVDTSVIVPRTRTRFNLLFYWFFYQFPRLVNLMNLLK